MSGSSGLKLSDAEYALMTCIDAFEETPPLESPNLRGYLRDLPAHLHTAALTELVQVDLERRAQAGRLLPITRYLQEYPELLAAAGLRDLLQADMQHRLAAGQTPDPSEYLKILPDFRPGTIATPQSDPLPRPAGDAVESPLVTTPKHPTQIGKYQVRRWIDGGGFGQVYLAHDPDLQLDVAIKVRRKLKGSRDLSDDQLNEARAVSKLSHAGIVRVFAADRDPEVGGYVVYEYVGGSTLLNRLQKHDYDRAQAVEWVARLAEALDCAHRQQVYHRDVKPANVVIDQEQNPKLIDFGLASHDGRFFADVQGKLLGSTPYMSPEVALRDPHWANAQSDLYSLGVVLFELLCGRQPFVEENDDKLIDAILRRAAPHPRSIDPTIPEDLEAICLRCLAKEPNARFSTGRDLAEALRATVAVAPPADSWLRKLTRWSAAAVAVAAMCVLIVWNMVPPLPVELPRVETFQATTLVDGVERQLSGIRDLPLADGQPLFLYTAFDRPAYAYLIAFAQDGPARLLWPSRANLTAHMPSTRIKYPEPGQPGWMVPAAGGGTLLIVILRQEPLSRESLDSLLKTPLLLNAPAAEVAQARFGFSIQENSEVAPTEGFPLRSAASAAAQRLEIDPAISAQLDQVADSYYGMIITHRPQQPSQEK